MMRRILLGVFAVLIFCGVALASLTNAPVVPVAACTNSTTPVSSGTGCNCQMLTAAQFKAASVTPVNIVTSPGAGHTLLVACVGEKYNFVTTPYNPFIAGIGLAYAGQSFSNVSGIPIGDTTGLPSFVAAQNGSTYASVCPNLISVPALTAVSNKNLQLATVTPGYDSGPITSVNATPIAAGTGYVNGDTGIVDPAGAQSNSDATYVVDTTGGGGSVAAFHIVDPGTGYGPSPHTYDTGTGGAQPGIGTGFRLSVTGNGSGDGTVTVCVNYTVVPF